MSIQWRLGTLLVQLLVLGIATTMVLGEPYSSDTWYIAGMLAIVINPQLLEPRYTRPVDSVANALIALVLIITAHKSAVAPGWYICSAFMLVALCAGILALVLGANRDDGRGVGFARSAKIIAAEATALRIYSAIFWLSLFEEYTVSQKEFWILGTAWAVIAVTGDVNWQVVWATARGKPSVLRVEGLLGPSRLLVAAPFLPPLRSIVEITYRATTVAGVLVSRIARADDVWGQVHFDSPATAEKLLQASSLSITNTSQTDENHIGVVDAGSTNEHLEFDATKELHVGQVVIARGGEQDVLYQVASGDVRQTAIKGGASLFTRAKAQQLGIFDRQQLRLGRYRWVPAPGAAVKRVPANQAGELPAIPAHTMRLGSVISTDIPILMDCQALAEGHLAILGMTRMGKTTLAVRLAEAMGRTHRVTILDQTGEYIGKRGLARHTAAFDNGGPGVAVLEPAVGAVAADDALHYLERIVALARQEYQGGVPRPRAVFVDEAHQFIPEPAGLGFNAPGRDSAFKFGLLMMQVRKYGIMIVVISQRTAVVAKSALSQCENLIAFKSVDQTGLDYIESFAGGMARDILPMLRQGEALVVGPAISSDTPVAIAVRQ